MDELEIDGRRLRIANLDRVVFPEAGTTKAELLDFYARISPVLLPHLRERLLHMHRYPEGVGGPSFWAKQCPAHRPPWVVTTPVWSAEKRANIDFCVVDGVAALLWAVNIGSLELHTSLHRREDLDRPTVVAFDLDPGDGVGLAACCEVALWLREVLAAAGLRGHPKTSGSKGLQVYVPLGSDATYAQTKPFSRAVAELLEAEHPRRVVARMARELRRGRVLVDWSQNTPHKSMVVAYSARARTRPTVSMPVTWAEVEAVAGGADPAGLRWELAAALERVGRVGDLFAPVLSERQRLASS